MLWRGCQAEDNAAGFQATVILIPAIKPYEAEGERLIFCTFGWNAARLSVGLTREMPQFSAKFSAREGG
jgi:hypothetical protein